MLLILQVDHEGAQKHTRTKFDEFTELQDIFVELVVVDDGEDGLVQSLQLFHIVNRHITQLYYATATSNHSNSCSQMLNTVLYTLLTVNFYSSSY